MLDARRWFGGRYALFVALLPLLLTIKAQASNLLVNTESFYTIDDLDAGTDLSLIFGQTLGKKLTYQPMNQQYVFDDNVEIQGNVKLGIMNPGTPLMTISGSKVGIGNSQAPNLLSVGDGALSTLAGKAVTVSNTTGDSLFSLGQSASDRGRLKWIYSATPSNAYLAIGDSVGTHALVLQDLGGNVGINQLQPKTPLEVNGAMSGSNLTISQLSSCSTLTTDSSGLLSCGNSMIASTANATTTSNVLNTNVPGLSIPVAANTNYIIHCVLTTSANAAATGVQITVDGPAGPNQVTWTRQSCASATTSIYASLNAFGLTDARTNSAGTTRCIDTITIHLRNGLSAGNVTFAVRSERAGNAVTVHTGSVCKYETY